MSESGEYDDALVMLLELIWGEGYMAPGGPGNVEKMLRGIDTEGKRILDIGCGIGGPAFEMASKFGAEVVGIDLEVPLVERASAAARERGLADRCTFHSVDGRALPFDDASFDIVTSAGAVTQTSDKQALLDECFRVLRPGGYVSIYEWMKSEAKLSSEMHYWIEVEGLTYAMETLDRYGEIVRNAGFIDVETTDASDWYRAEARREYELLKGELFDRMVALIGREQADHFVENWRAMVVVCDKGEMRQGYCRGRKPNAA